MTKLQFSKQSFEYKIEFILQFGYYINKGVKDNKSVDLYSVCGFFVELIYDKNNMIETINMVNYDAIDAYLENISIAELFLV